MANIDQVASIALHQMNLIDDFFFSNDVLIKQEGYSSNSIKLPIMIVLSKFNLDWIEMDPEK